MEPSIKTDITAMKGRSRRGEKTIIVLRSLRNLCFSCGDLHYLLLILPKDTPVAQLQIWSRQERLPGRQSAQSCLSREIARLMTLNLADVLPSVIDIAQQAGA